MVITSMIIICTSIKNDGLNKLRNATASLNLFILQSKHHNQSEMLGRTDDRIDGHLQLGFRRGRGRRLAMKNKQF